jgi:Protein of unknown function (DUF3592)
MLAGMIRGLSAEVWEFARSRAALWVLMFRWILCIAGTVFVVVAVVLAGNTLLFLRTSVVATGTVLSNVRVEQRSSEDGQVTTTFSPEFTFADADGKSYTVLSANSSSPPEFAEGQTVRVLYNPVNPGSARIDSFTQLWVAPIIFGAFGVVVSAIGYTWMYFVMKRSREVLSIR